MSDKYYITVPIYYVNAAPHLGHSYSTMTADTICRWKRIQGFRTALTTGSDEHGLNVERAAKALGIEPREFATTMAEEFQRTFAALGLGVDYFQRTSAPEHHATVNWLFERARERGHVYAGVYTGQYCIYCSLYVNEAKPGDPCPDCNRPTETVTEENYFFRLSAFQQPLLELYEKQPDFIRPEIRRNEVVSFVKGGLNDLSITRTSIKWGIPVVSDPKHVFYVWFDALIAYLTAVKDKDYWPADLHLIGKEILRFHAVYWPAFLMAADLPLPKGIYAHGWLLFEQEKMSKSRGNVVRATPIQQVAGLDVLRYFLLREVVFGQDGNFSYDALVGRYNADLANGLGNLASRTLNMIQQYRGGVIPAGGDAQCEAAARDTIAAVTGLYDRLEFSKALEAIWSLISTADKFIVERAPWKLARDQSAEARQRLDDTLYASAEVLRIATALLAPVMPTACGKIWQQLGMAGPLEKLPIESVTWGRLAAGQKIGVIEAVFPRLEASQVIAKMRALEAEELDRQAALLGAKPAPVAEPQGEKISIEDFGKVDMRAGVVKFAERVKGSDKLLLLKVDIGEAEPRTLVAGIAEAYTPEQMLGRQVVIVANLQPRKLRGIESNGMIVAASIGDGKPVLAGFLEDVPAGARLK